jgi:peptide/nickel transport system ATP-binding protein
LHSLSRRVLQPHRKKHPDDLPGPLSLAQSAADASATSSPKGRSITGRRTKTALARARDLLRLVDLHLVRSRAIRTSSPAASASASPLLAHWRWIRTLLVADEAVSALDVSVQAQVLASCSTRSVTRLGIAILFITHDLRVAAQICDRIVMVMQHGRDRRTGAGQRCPRPSAA